MLRLKRKEFSLDSEEKLILKTAGALGLAGSGIIAGSIIGKKKGAKKASEEEVQETAKRIAREKKQEAKRKKEYLKENLPDIDDQDYLDKEESEMTKEEISDAMKQYRKLKKNPELARELTKTATKYSRIGAVSGGILAPVAGYGVYKFAKHLKKKG